MNIQYIYSISLFYILMSYIYHYTKENYIFALTYYLFFIILFYYYIEFVFQHSILKYSKKLILDSDERILNYYMFDNAILTKNLVYFDMERFISSFEKPFVSWWKSDTNPNLLLAKYITLFFDNKRMDFFKELGLEDISFVMNKNNQWIALVYGFKGDFVLNNFMGRKVILL